MLILNFTTRTAGPATPSLTWISAEASQLVWATHTDYTWALCCRLHPGTTSWAAKTPCCSALLDLAPTLLHTLVPSQTPCPTLCVGPTLPGHFTLFICQPAVQVRGASLREASPDCWVCPANSCKATHLSNVELDISGVDYSVNVCFLHLVHAGTHLSCSSFYF